MEWVWGWIFIPCLPCHYTTWIRDICQIWYHIESLDLIVDIFLTKILCSSLNIVKCIKREILFLKYSKNVEFHSNIYYLTLPTSMPFLRPSPKETPKYIKFWCKSLQCGTKICTILGAKWYKVNNITQMVQNQIYPFSMYHTNWWTVFVEFELYIFYIIKLLLLLLWFKINFTNVKNNN